MSATTQITLEEFLDLPDTPGKQELLDGELIVKPVAKSDHMRISVDVCFLLAAAVPKSRVWHETGYQLTRGWLQPDVSVSWPDQPVVNGWLQRAPMLAVEVVSPSNMAQDLERKIAACLEEGAAEVWVIYPTTHSMTIFRKESCERVTATYACSLLNLTIDLAALLP